MKLKIILFVSNMLLLTFVYAQSQMLKGTVLPVSEEQGILFLPLAAKVAVTDKTTEKPSTISLSVDTIPVKVKKNAIDNGASKSKTDTLTKVQNVFKANYSLQSLDTSRMAKNSDAIILPVKSNLKGQTISGTIVSKPGLSTVLEPLPFIIKSVAVNESIPIAIHVTSSPVTSVSSVKPMDLLDTSKLDKKDIVGSYSTPVSKSGLVSQNIKGVFSSATGSSSIIEPISSDALAVKEAEKFNKGKNEVTENATMEVRTPGVKWYYLIKNRESVASPMDFLDTTETRRRDYISSYSTPPVKINLKAQNIIGSIVAIRGKSTIIEPISPDSLLAREADRIYKLQMAASASAGSEKVTVLPSNVEASPLETTQSSASYPVRNAYSPIPVSDSKKVIVSNSSSSGSRKSIELPSKQKNARNIAFTSSAAVPRVEVAKPGSNNDAKFNFFVNQFGKFNIRISSNYFYLNITQNGKLTDYAILADGQVAGSNSHTTQLGKLKITFDNRGWIETIAGYELTYTYDGRVNKVGNIYINYDTEGRIIKVGTVDINFNSNSTVEKFANYRVGYIRRRVIGIDDSNGLVIYRPVVEDDNKPNF